MLLAWQMKARILLRAEGRYLGSHKASSWDFKIANTSPNPHPGLINPPPLNRDNNGDPNIKAFKRRGGLLIMGLNWVAVKELKLSYHNGYI